MLAQTVAPERDRESSSAGRIRSTIAFPYVDLAEAEKVAQVLHDDGGDSGDLPSLAAWMGARSAGSGSFRLKVTAARVFNLLDGDSRNVALTQLGRAIVDSATRESARAEAFLACPLYEAIYSAYEGALLPKDAGLEKQMRDLGVAPKQTPVARQVMARSALHAGFFAYGQDRLVRPAVSLDRADAHDSDSSTGDGESRDSDAKPDGNVKVVSLRSGGQVTLSVSAGLMVLSPNDRAFVFELVDKLVEYEGKAKRDIAADSEPATVDHEAV